MSNSGTHLSIGPRNCFPNLTPIIKSKTGGSRPAGRHTFVRQQKYAKVPSPCGGHLLCLISEASTNDTALEAGPLQGGPPVQCDLWGKSLKA